LIELQDHLKERPPYQLNYLQVCCRWFLFTCACVLPPVLTHEWPLSKSNTSTRRLSPRLFTNARACFHP